MRVSKFCLIITVVSLLLAACAHNSDRRKSSIKTAFSHYLNILTTKNVSLKAMTPYLSKEFQFRISQNPDKGITTAQTIAGLQLPARMKIQSETSSISNKSGCLLINGVHPTFGKSSLFISYKNESHQWLINKIHFVMLDKEKPFIKQPDCEKNKPAW